MTIFLDAAVAIGRTICDSAYWDRTSSRSNWVGRLAVGTVSGAEGMPPRAAALGPDLYGGTSGVALFLGELFGRTGETEFRRAAIGAIKQAIHQGKSQLHEPHTASALSFFNGALGVAYVACRLAKLTSDEEVIDLAITLLGRLNEGQRTSRPLDLIGGNAGAIPALLALDRMGIGQDCKELVTSLAEEICANATRENNYAIWQPKTTGRADVASAPLTGFAHGAAGIGLALLEAYAETNCPDFLEYGRLAFAYEDAHFNPGLSNWPDFRHVFGAGKVTPYAVAWCHGAGGISLSRLCAMSLDHAHRDALAMVARAGLRRTGDAIDHRTRLVFQDLTLCHGILGLNDILLAGGIVLGEEGYIDQARKTGQDLIHRHSKNGNWQTGTGGPTPSLMLGTAGVGHHLLRLDAPLQVPMILALTRLDANTPEPRRST
jgi:lantibiotic modifying enzyme